MATSLDSRGAEGTDPGAVDNRLSLDPNDPNWKKTIANWEDGEEYQLTVTVTQLSPGEFEVTGVTSESESPEEESDTEEEAEPMMKGKPNKAVRGMMAGM